MSTKTREVVLLVTLTASLIIGKPAVGEHSDRVLQSATSNCQDNAPPDAPPNGFAPFEILSQVAATAPNTYSKYRQLLPEYPDKVFAAGEYGNRGLQYFATLSGGAAQTKQFAWTVMSVPRLVKPEERNGHYALWDAVILEVERPFASILESAAGQAARERFEDAKKRSPATIMPDNREMATFTVARGNNPVEAVYGHWQSLLGEWMMDVILRAYPKRQASFGETIGYDHIAYLHALTDSRFSPGSKYTFVSNTKLAMVGPPAFAFLIDSSGKCIAAQSIKTIAGRR